MAEISGKLMADRVEPFKNVTLGRVVGTFAM